MASSQSPRKENRLGLERSPYLLQHRHNPVDWFPWGPEAFEKAKKENKLIFLSVGYSTCHWCHVMERESFECEETGALLNRHFVPVKVDREERPDVDKLYMTFIQAISGGGGWPMSVFLTPSLCPITGGTYFPPEDRYGRPGFKSILKYIAAQWSEKAAEVADQGHMFHDAIAKLEDKNVSDSGELPPTETLDKCFQMMHKQFDPRFGGIGKEPKFPQPSNYEFLLRYAVWAGLGTADGAAALGGVEATLRGMWRGGIHDWVSRGFHRYSTDARWHVPHFEKMLYDNAQIASLAAEVYQITGKPCYAEMVRDILTYVDRDLSHPDGGFYSAEDADSLPQAEDTEKKEGAFCVWSHQELCNLLVDPVKAGSQHKLCDLVIAHFGVKEGGNVDPHGDPHGELKGQNVLISSSTVAESGKEFGLDEEETKDALEKARSKMFEARALRPKPHLDDKIITAWNGLMLSGFAKAAAVLGEPSYLKRAKEAASFIRTHLRRPDGGLLRLCYTAEHRVGGVAQIAAPVGGFVDDYAFLIQGLLDLYSASGEAEWLEWALELEGRMAGEFWDGRGSFFLSAEGGDPALLLRMRDDQDGAEPSSNSVAALNGVRLAALLDDAARLARAEAVLKGWADRLTKIPIVLPKMLCALAALHKPPPQVVIVGKPDDTARAALVAATHKHFLPEASIIVLDEEGSDWLRKANAHLAEMKCVDGKATAFVCRNFACSLPVHSPEQLTEQLRSL